MGGARSKGGPRAIVIVRLGGPKSEKVMGIGTDGAYDNLTPEVKKETLEIIKKLGRLNSPS